MVQPSLFENVRRTDPVTSQQAAQSLTPAVLGAQRREVLKVVALFDQHAVAWKVEGATAYDVHQWTDIQQNVAARRCTDLARLGLIKDSGRTRPGSSNRELTVWVITDQGRKAIT